MNKSISKRDQHHTIANVTLWLAFFTLYALTTTPEILPADSGEFQLAAARWGILHPPGYPLYTMASALWMRLIPLGRTTFRINLFSAALAATTLVCIAEAARTWATSWGHAGRAAQTSWLITALALGTAPTFWSQATFANIRIPTLLFASWGLWALAQYADAIKQARVDNRTDDPKCKKSLLNLALAMGLGIGHHPSLAFAAVGYLIYLILIDPPLLWQIRRWWKSALIAALAWLVPQLYIPIRGTMPNVPLAGTGLNTWDGFWHHVLARGFSGDMFAFANPADLALRLPILSSLFKFQFYPVLLLGAFLGWLWLLRRHWRLAVGLFTSWAIHSFITITYRAPQTIEYLMPAYLPIALCLGLGTAALLQTWSAHKLHGDAHFIQHASRPAVYAILLLLVLRLLITLPNFITLSKDTSIRDRTQPLLEQAPEDALVLADWRWATPLWVLQQVEGTRPDVDVTYVYPVAGKAYDQVWQDRAQEAGERPLLTTHAYQWEGWVAAPVGGGYRYYRTPLQDLPEELAYTPLDADLGPVHLLGYRIAGEFNPGSTVEVQLAWQANGSQEPAPSLTARLFDSNGAFLVNNDRFLGTNTPQGEVQFTNITLQMPIGICPNSVIPTIGVYTVQDGSFNNLGDINLPESPVTCSAPTMPTERPWPGVLLGKGPLLRGIDYHVSGEQAIAYLHFCGPGQAFIIQNGETQIAVPKLRIGQCQTLSLPIAAGERPTFSFSRPDGSQAHLLSRPFPIPKDGDCYVPFGDKMVLTDVKQQERGGYFVLDLNWQSTQPLIDDYAVSVRLQTDDGTLLGTHDIQPGLGDIPTLKWVVRGANFLDPHPFTQPEILPSQATIAVYERFRLATLPGPGNRPVLVALP